MKKFNCCLSAVLLTIAGLFSAFAQETPKVLREAGVLMERGDLKGAIAVLDKAVEKQKDSFEIYEMRSALRMFNGDLAGASADLSRAIEIKPGAELYVKRAGIRTFLREAEGALSDYNYAISHGYKTEKAYSGRAMLKRTLNDLDGAIEDYQIAVAMNPDAVQAHVGLASTLDQKGKIDGAIEILQGFVDRYEGKRDGTLPKSKFEPTGQNVLLKDEKSENEDTQKFIFGQQMKSSVVVESREEAEKLASKQERILNISLVYANLAQMQERKGEYETALANVNKSLSIYKNDFYSIGLRGKILTATGDLNGALNDLNASIKSNPTMLAPYADRGIALLLLGRDEDAQKDFDKYLQMFPKGAENLNKRIEQAKKKRSEQPLSTENK